MFPSYHAESHLPSAGYFPSFPVSVASCLTTNAPTNTPPGRCTAAPPDTPSTVPNVAMCLYQRYSHQFDNLPVCGAAVSSWIHAGTHYDPQLSRVLDQSSAQSFVTVLNACSAAFGGSITLFPAAFFGSSFCDASTAKLYTQSDFGSVTPDDLNGVSATDPSESARICN